MITKLTIWILSIILSLSFGFGICHAASLDPMKLGVGARSLAMGRTAASLAGNINSMFINPANAADFKGWGATSMYTTLLEGEITYTLLGGGYQAPWGTFGLSYLGGLTSGIQIATRDADSRIVASGTSFDYSNSVISLVYGKEIMENLAAGATLKLFSKGFSGSSGSTASGFDMDLGLLWKPRKDFSLGVSQQNTLPASIASITWGTGEKEGIPFNTKIGCAYTPRNDLLITGDLDYARNSPLLLHAGVEWRYSELLAIRGGLDQIAINQNEATTNLGLGIGLNSNGFSFDYAYYIDTLLSANSTHYFTFSYLLPEKKIKAPPKKVKAPPGFSDVPQGYWAKEAIETLAEKGIIGGYPDGTFKPEKTLTRAELSTLLIKAKKIKVAKPKEQIFNDLPVKHWAAPYIKAAVDIKLVGGYPDGTFQPSKTLNRVEGVLILSRFANLKPIREESPFIDLPASHWAAPNIIAAKKAGLLDYIPGDSLEPNKDFSRAEAAYILHSITK
ncbi:MAG: S-layer homology domain-containing protein [Candidatus Margulisiibacteriota bacterium]